MWFAYLSDLYSLMLWLWRKGLCWSEAKSNRDPDHAESWASVFEEHKLFREGQDDREEGKQKSQRKSDADTRVSIGADGICIGNQCSYSVFEDCLVGNFSAYGRCA